MFISFNLFRTWFSNLAPRTTAERVLLLMLIIIKKIVSIFSVMKWKEMKRNEEKLDLIIKGESFFMQKHCKHKAEVRRKQCRSAAKAMQKCGISVNICFIKRLVCNSYTKRKFMSIHVLSQLYHGCTMIVLCYKYKSQSWFSWILLVSF